MKFLQVFSVILLGFLTISDGAKILAIFNMASRSHYILGNTYLRALAEAGHDVTMVSPFEEKSPPKNGSYRNIILEGFIEEHRKMLDERNMTTNGFTPLMMIEFIIHGGANMTNRTLRDPNLQALIHSGEKFDVVVIEQFMNDGLKVLAPHFGAHLVIFSTLGANSWLNPLVCNPSPLSYVSEMLLSFAPPLNFPQRFLNVLFNILGTAVAHIFQYPAQQKLAEEFLPNTNFEAALYNASLVFLNSHPSLNSPVPHVPNMVEIGGFHVNPPKKLPKDLQEFLDSATEGFIYFSMGSNLKSRHFAGSLRTAVVNTFSKLKLKVLWKWEDDEVPGLSSNVKLGKWLPQQDVLAHPNAKIFITHGGLLSTIETVYHGVPIIAIPVFGDQKMNAKTAENGGYGLVLPLEDVTEELLTEKINQILTNPRYHEVAKTRSKILLDRQVKPIDSAVYWTEYIIRHNGAPHLRVAGLDLPWYKYHLVDVFAFIFAVFLVSFLVIKKLVCSLCKLFRCKKNKVDIKKKTS